MSNSVKHSDYFLYYHSNIVCSSYACYICVLYGLKNTPLLFPHTTINYGFLYKRECIYCTMWTRPCNTVQLNFRANAELVTKLHIALNASHAVVPKINPKIYSKIHPSEYNQNFFLNAALQTQNSAYMFNFCSLLHTPNSQLHHLTFFTF